MFSYSSMSFAASSRSREIVLLPRIQCYLRFLTGQMGSSTQTRLITTPFLKCLLTEIRSARGDRKCWVFPSISTVRAAKSEGRGTIPGSISMTRWLYSRFFCQFIGVEATGEAFVTICRGFRYDYVDGKSVHRKMPFQIVAKNLILAAISTLASSAMLALGSRTSPGKGIRAGSVVTSYATSSMAVASKIPYFIMMSME